MIAKIPIWKRILSYIAEIHLESCSTEINTELHVVLKNGRVQLCSANAIYSFEDLYKNFSLLFNKMNLAPFNDGRILILGYGLGSIPIILEKFGSSNYSITGVELDEEIIYLYNKYSAHRVKSSTQLICADANIFVKNCSETFDLIIVDIFLDDIIPHEVLSLEFLANAQKLLSDKNSLLVMNTMYNNDFHQSKSNLYFRTIFNKVFPEALSLQLHKNLMLINKEESII